MLSIIIFIVVLVGIGLKGVIMNVRTRPRTSIGVTKTQLTIGFKTKSKFASTNGSALLEALYMVVLNNGETYKEYGYSNGNPLLDSKVMFEGASLNAKCKVLYRNGYFVDQQNYEELDIEKVDDAKLLDYNFFYPENEFSTYETHKNKKDQFVMTRRNRKGQIKERRVVDYDGRTSVRHDSKEYERRVIMERKDIKTLDDEDLISLHEEYVKELKKRKLLKQK